MPGTWACRRKLRDLPVLGSYPLNDVDLRADMLGRCCPSRPQHLPCGSV